MAAVLEWHGEHGRDLVIRGSRDPYAIWVGEVMSQQTQVRRVGEALHAFLARFPDVAALAAGSTGDVVRAWGGLGYPRRAMALRDAARLMVERHDGRVPRSVTELEALPGIGPYTARAIAATAYDVPVTALDVNARRVLGRVLDGMPLPPSPSPGAQGRADALAPPKRAADWNHALMDLGAGVCRPTPDCAACPLARWCRFAAGGSDATTTGPTRRAHRPFQTTNRFVRGRVLALLRDAPDERWSELDPEALPIPPEALAIATERLDQALRGLAADGLIELAQGPDGRPRARLPSA